MNNRVCHKQRYDELQSDFIRTINFLLYEYLIQYVNGVMCLITSIPFVNFECLIFDTFTFCVQHNNKKRSL